MKVSIFGLGFKALKALKTLDASALEKIEQVIIGKDKNIQKDYSEEIEVFCIENNIDFQFKKDKINTSSKIIIAIGWRWIIPKRKEQRIVVFHDSILPKYRGFNPLVTALINGDKEIGVTALFGENNYDTGNIIEIEKCNISYPIKIEKAIDFISNCYGLLLKKIIDKFSSGNIKSIPQKKDNVSYSLWRDFEDYYINWDWPADKIKRQVDATGFPYLGARTRIEKAEYIISEVTEIEDVIIENRTPGKVIFKNEGKPVIVCGKGLIRVDEMINTINNKVDFPKKFRIRLY